jgi:hypothetical protein
MRTTLFLSTLLATALFGGSALAERTSDDTVKTHAASPRELKEQIVRDSQQKHEDPSTKNENVAGQKAPAQLQPSRAKGDTYDHYGQTRSGNSTPNVATNNTNQKAQKAPLSMQPGRAHGDTVDPASTKRPTSTNGYKATVGSTQFTWTAGSKNVRSFVHFTNDKGQTNNNIHGATASAEKMRTVAGMIMGTAGLALCHMSWQTTGGDAMSLFPGD